MESVQNQTHDGWRRGMELLQAGDAAGAIATLQPYVSANPQSFEAHHFLGAALSQLGRHEEAIRHLQSALNLNAQSAPVHFNLGLANENLGRVDAARREFKEALRLDARHAGALLAMTRLDAGVPAPSMSTATASSSATGPNPWSQTSSAERQIGVAELAADARAAKPDFLNVLGGFMLGALASLACAIIWDKLSFYTGYQIGYVAIGVGFAVGTAVLFGASGKRGVALQLVSALLSLSGILLGEVLWIFDSVRTQPGVGVGMTGTGGTLALLIGSFMVLPRVLVDHPIGFLFILLGIYYGWTIPAPLKESAPEVEAPLQNSSDTLGGNPVAFPSASPTIGAAGKPLPDSAFDAPPSVEAPSKLDAPPRL